MPQFELHGGVRLEVVEGHSAEFVGDYDSGAVLWAASPPLARWLASEGDFAGDTHSVTVADGAGDEDTSAAVGASSMAAVELGCGAGLV